MALQQINSQSSNFDIAKINKLKFVGQGRMLVQPKTILQKIKKKTFPLLEGLEASCQENMGPTLCGQESSEWYEFSSIFRVIEPAKWDVLCLPGQCSLYSKVRKKWF